MTKVVTLLNSPELKAYFGGENCIWKYTFSSGEFSKGTYIRSLAHDFSKELGNGACLKSLRRKRIGDFKVEDAWQLEDLKQYIIDTGEEFKAMKVAEANKK